ncbi:MAG: hypothetical protein BMS9Abin07_0051 [Acidimicrobiia bacterium]|nr:MAG: hypothetical protein BMS9Abin07_0051 [Acidimicrobiia bacterium]
MLSRSIVAVARRPFLWPTALGALVAMSPRRWWARPPFLPIPEHDLVRWRVTTAYGDPEATLAEDDLVAYLEWRHRAARGLTRGG